jgi:hypothetical protein
MRRIQNKKILLGLMILSGLSMFSQSIEKLYVGMPDRINPTTTKKIRLEMLEYHKAGQGDSIQNRFGGNAYLQTFDTLNNRIVVKNTESTFFEMKLLKADDGAPIVGVIQSVCSPICHSVVVFYDTAWNKLPVQFDMPKAKQWIDQKKFEDAPNLDKVWVINVLENSFVSLRFDVANQWIIATNNSAEFLSDADRKVIQPILDDKPIIFQLEARKWIQKP